MIAPTMDTPHTAQKHPRRTPRRAPALGLLAALLLAAPAAAQGEARPDQVIRQNARTGKVTTVTGVITENSLEAVRIEKDGKPTKVNSPDVLQVIWGDVPPSFKDGRTYSSRGDFENAVAKFRVSAGDASAREVVKAASRRNAAEALLSWSASDANQLSECISECDRFLTDFPSNRQVPRIRWIQARAALLTGDAAAAATAFKSLYEEGANDPATTGYDRETCLRAGIDAAHAALAAGDSVNARTLFSDLERAFASMIAALEPDADSARTRLQGAEGEASTGEGYCMLQSGQTKEAISFFTSRLTRTGIPAAERYSSMLGLAKSYMADGETRKAMIQFASIALDHTSRDRIAAALLGHADAAIKLQDQDASQTATILLETLTKSYGDTPSARPGAELLATLK